MPVLRIKTICSDIPPQLHGDDLKIATKQKELEGFSWQQMLLRIRSFNNLCGISGLPGTPQGAPQGMLMESQRGLGWRDPKFHPEPPAMAGIPSPGPGAPTPKSRTMFRAPGAATTPQECCCCSKHSRLKGSPAQDNDVLEF